MGDLTCLRELVEANLLDQRVVRLPRQGAHRTMYIVTKNDKVTNQLMAGSTECQRGIYSIEIFILYRRGSNDRA